MEHLATGCCTYNPHLAALADGEPLPIRSVREFARVPVEALVTYRGFVHTVGNLPALYAATGHGRHSAAIGRERHAVHGPFVAVGQRRWPDVQ